MLEAMSGAEDRLRWVLAIAVDEDVLEVLRVVVPAQEFFLTNGVVLCDRRADGFGRGQVGKRHVASLFGGRAASRTYGEASCGRRPPRGSRRSKEHDVEPGRPHGAATRVSTGSAGATRRAG